LREDMAGKYGGFKNAHGCYRALGRAVYFNAQTLLPEGV
jgi:hypothetical protein